jgi:valyl-tRNA synthetase
MASKYDFKEVEEKLKKFWEKEKVYKFDNKAKKKAYSIDTPPPTVSGNMHIGHAFSYSQQDFIARFRRMFDGNVFYPFGTDDNGLPTERLIERLKKVKSKEMSRSEFIKLCLKTLKEITPDFILDWKNLGISCDYGIIYSTIDENSQKLSQKSFIDLYNKNHVYKKEFPTIWCPECQTSIAQAELENKEFGSVFSTIKFKCDTLKGTGSEDLLIATTRPEFLPACVAIFVNPKDEKHKSFIGKKAKIPLFDFEVPIIADKSAEMDKGTGVMMVCTYGDKFDVDSVNRYKLEEKIIFNKDGTMKIKEYEGMKIKDARKKILSELKEQDFVTEQKQIEHAVNVHDKCGTEIEFLPTEQWFIKVLDKKKQLIQQGKKVKWYPKFMHKRYENWVNGLDWDWNISRNRHFGIPIPVWECKECNEIILAKENELPIDPVEIKKKCPKCKKEAEPEKMVLDTWATSSLTPQIASSLIDNKVVIPYSLRPQAHDIIRTWAFYTIAKAYLHEKKIPWGDIAISGNVSLKGEKMSKSKGNVIDPKKVLDDYGADSLRFWAAGSKLGNDLDYLEKDVLTGKKFVNKLLNASNFVFMNLEDYSGKRPNKLNLIDQVFLKKLNDIMKEATNYFEKYEYSKAKAVVEQFFWKDFADNYIEIVKKRVYQGKGNEKESAQYTLYTSLLAIVKMMAPITPFITEEIYQTHFKKYENEKSIHVSKWPDYVKTIGDRDNLFEVFVNTLTDIRVEKSKAKKSMNSEIILFLNKSIKKRLEPVLNDLKNVTNAFEIKEGKFKVEFLEK